MLVCLARQELIEQRPRLGPRDPRLLACSSWARCRTTDTRALIRQLLPADAASDDVREQLTARAEGNPLFLQQMIAFLRETGGDAVDVSVPPTIHALLAARLDRLTVAGAARDRRRLGDRARVLGRGRRGARRRRRRSPAVLETLTRKQLVAPEPSTFEGETGFAFSHILVRDAAYESITKEDRAELHERLADWLEQRHAERMIELEAILGHHLERAHRYRAELGRGRRALVRARRSAPRITSRPPAAARCAPARTPRRSGLLERAGALLPATARGRLELLPAIGESLEGTANHTQAGEIYEEALERALSAGERRVEGLARLGRAHVWFVAHPEVPASRLVDETEHAIRLLEHTGRRARPRRRLAAAGRDAHVRRAARATGSRRSSTRCSTPTPNTLPRHWNAISLRDGHVPARRPRAARAGHARSRRSTSPPPASAACARWRPTCCTCSASGSGGAGNFDEARAALSESTAISEDMGLLYMSQWSKRSRGRMELAAGDAVAAERALRESWEVLTQMGLQSSLGETAVPLAEALYAQGRFDEADATLKALNEDWAARRKRQRSAARAARQAARGRRVDAARRGDRGPRAAARARDRLALPAGRTRCSRTPR